MTATMNEIVWPTIVGTALGLAVVGAVRKGVFKSLRSRLFGRAA